MASGAIYQRQNNLALSCHWVLFVALSAVPLTFAHNEDDDITYEDRMKTGYTKPLPLILRLHAILQLISWAIVFPTGFVLGLSKSRYHVPCQIAGTVLTLPGFLLPRFSDGRHQHSNAHTVLGSILAWYLLSQVACGIFLKFHFYQNSRVRSLVQMLHSFLGCCLPVISWTQLLLGGITGLRICFGTYTGHCVAYFMMGSSFIFYAILSLLIVHFGQPWLARRGHSQEFLDCCVITAWGIVIAVAAHGPGTEWSHRDMQHTNLGIFWAFAGALGMFLSRQRHRCVLPALILMVTGWAVGTNEQPTPYSSLVHTVFGYTLIAAGLSKLVDSCVVVNSKSRSWQHTSPFLLTVAGVMFLSSTEQQLRKVLVKQIDHPTYALIQISTAAAIYLFVNVLLSLYQRVMLGQETGQDEAYECLDTFDSSEQAHTEIKTLTIQERWSP